MDSIVNAGVFHETNTGRRCWSSSETPYRGRVPLNTALDPLHHDSPPEVGLIEIETGSERYGIVPRGQDELFVRQSSDTVSAIVDLRAKDVLVRIPRLLALVALHAMMARNDYLDLVKRVLRCSISIQSENGVIAPAVQLDSPADKWMAQVRAWAASHPQRDRVIDDSRDTIYGDTGP